MTVIIAACCTLAAMAVATMPDNNQENDSVNHLSNNGFSKKTASPGISKNTSNAKHFHFKVLRAIHSQYAESTKSVDNQSSLHSNPSRVLPKENAGEAGSIDNRDRIPVKTVVFGFLLSTMVVLVFFAIQNYFSPVTIDQTAETIPSSKEKINRINKPQRSFTNRPLDIRAIVANLTQENPWDVQKIHILKRNWQNLDPNMQWEISQEDWFRRFLNALEKQIQMPVEHSVLNNNLSMARNTSLRELNAMLQDLEKPVTTARKSVNTNEFSTNPPNTEPTQTKRGEKPFDNNQPTQPTMTVNPSVSLIQRQQTDAIDNTMPITDLSAGGSAEINSVTNSSSLSQTHTQRPPTNAVMIVSPENDSPASQADILSQNKAGSGHSNKNNNEQAGQSDVIKTHRVKLNVLQPPPETDDKIQNKPVSLVKINDKPVKSASVQEEEKYNYVNGLFEGLSKTRDPNKPTIAELNDLTVQLSSSYEAGDLERFSSFFNNNAENDNYETLNQVKKEFENLLNDTSDRQMFIRDMQWSYNQNFAIGKGELTLILISDVDAEIFTRKQKILMTVSKQNKRLSIHQFEQANK